MSYLRKPFVLFAFVLSFVSGCSQSDELNFATHGIGTSVHSDSIDHQYRMHRTYFGHLCATAEIPHGIGSEGTPYCVYDGFRETDWNTMVQAGLNDIDLRCDAYLAWLDNRKRSQSPLLKQLSDTATRTQAILRFAGSTDLAIDVVAQVFGYAADSVINYNSRLLFEIDTSTVQALVLGRQRDFREQLIDLAFNNKPAVEHALRSYLRICLPFTIETEINNVVTVFQRTGGEASVPLISAETAGAAVRATRTFSAAPLTSGQAVTVTRPRPPPVQSERAKALFKAEGFTDTDVDEAQDALCVPRGPVGPKTLTGVRIFETFMSDLPEVKQDGRITDQAEFTVVVTRRQGEPVCDRSRFRNIFEHKVLNSPQALRGLIILLNDKVPKGEPVKEDAPLDDPALRAKIAEANRQFGIHTHDGHARDHFLPGTAAALQFQ